MSWFYDLQDLLFEFLEKGGPVVLLIGVLIMVMWILIFERLWFFRFSKPQLIQDARDQWDQVRSENGGPGRKSWEGHMIRSMLISQASSSINSMAGLFASIPALLALRSIDQAAKKNIEILTERLTYDKKFDVI